jgi:hypothetical protein
MNNDFRWPDRLPDKPHPDDEEDDREARDQKREEEEYAADQLRGERRDE